MIFKKTILAISCSLVLAACGGGGGDASNSGTSGSGSASQSNPEKDMAAAKQLVASAKNIVAYYDSFSDIADQYKAPIDAIDATASDMGNGSNLILNLVSLAVDDAEKNGGAKVYDAAELEKLLIENYRGYYSPYSLENNTLKVIVAADSIQVTGSVDAKYFQGFDTANYIPGSAYPPILFGNKTHVQVGNLDLAIPLVSSTETHIFKIKQGGSITTKNENAETATLSFNQDSIVQATYSTVAQLKDRKELDGALAAMFKFAGVKFSSGSLSATLSEFSAQAKQAHFKQGTFTNSQLVPYELIIKGLAQVEQETLNIDSKITLNNDLSKVIDLDTLENTAANFINAKLTVSLSGNLKGGKSAIKPFTINLEANRAAYAQGTAKVNVSVDQSALTVDLTAKDLDKNVQVLSAVIQEGAGASITISDIQNFTAADIMVAGKKYGTLTKNSAGQYVASFTDRTLEYITP